MSERDPLTDAEVTQDVEEAGLENAVRNSGDEPPAYLSGNAFSDEEVDDDDDDDNRDRR